MTRGKQVDGREALRQGTAPHASARHAVWAQRLHAIAVRAEQRREAGQTKGATIPSVKGDVCCLGMLAGQSFAKLWLLSAFLAVCGLLSTDLTISSRDDQGACQEHRRPTVVSNA